MKRLARLAARGGRLTFACAAALLGPAAQAVGGAATGPAPAAGGSGWQAATLWAMGALVAASGAWSALRRRRRPAAQRAAAEPPAPALEVLQAVAEASPDAIFAKDLDGRYLVMNRTAAALMGTNAAAALGRRAQDLFAPELAGRIEALDRQIVANGEPQTIEEGIETAQGRRSYLTTKGPLRDARGRVAGVYGVSRDVTQVRRHEEELARLHLAVEQSSEAIVITDLDACVVYANAAALASTGYAREELVGRNCRVFQSGRTPPASYVALWQALTQGRPWRGMLINRRKDGSEYVEESMITPVRAPDGRVTHYLAVKKDVTEQQRMAAELDQHRAHLEELVAQRTAELEQAQRAAESANRAKSAFLAMMSHEIRTPMSGVVGLADLLVQSSLSAYQGELVRTMRESSLGLLALIDDLLDFSKIEAGHLELEPTPLALRALVERACDALQPLAAQRDVMLQVFVDPALPAQVLLDGLRWRQILTNLVSNAIKFSAGLERPGRVRVQVARGADGALELSVVDNGIGMAAQALERIFQPYTQAERSTTRRYGGTGLGLSIVRRLANAFGGRVHVDSTAGVGSRFTVSVPLQPLAAEPADAAASDTELGGLHCHVCADDAALGADWAAYLAAAGAEVRTWAGPERMLEAIEREPRGGRVAVVGAEFSDARASDLRTAAQRMGIGLVLIGRGRRRTPRRGHGGEIGLDADALPRAALLRAVALAAGRAAAAAAGAEAAEAVDSPPADIAALARGRRVLLAEDNPVNQEVIARQLALLGVEAQAADDGEQALALWRSGRFALLLSDLHMPGLDGFELVQRIRAEERARQVAGAGAAAAPPAHLPVIGLTATAPQEAAERCRAAGMDDYLTKPISLERLAATMRRWLGAKAPADTDAAAAASDARPRDAAASALDGGDGVPPVYDPACLRALVGADEAVLDNIRRAFAQAAREGAGELGLALRERRFGAAHALAHRLRGAAASVGAAALAQACAGIENAAAAADFEALAAAGAGFEAAIAQLAPLLDPDAAGCAMPLPAATPAIVVVDDDPFQRELLRSQLAALLNVPVVCLPSGEAALELAARDDGAQLLLLVDLHMPGMDGIELIRLLAARGYRGALALSSAANERLLQSGERLALAHRLNVLGHLKKPVSMDDLRALVQRWRHHMPKPAREQGRPYDAQAVRRALERREFMLHYQPKLRLADGALAGVEALLRWRHPQDGLVMPAGFVDVVEESGLIGALTDEVLALALAQSRRWRDAGLAVRVAVNVSMDNLVQLDFPERVLARLAAHGLEPGDLLLEVTESRLMRDPRSALDILTRLRLNGVALAIDDFGTGHSSLAQLRDLPFDELKIDRGFVHDCATRATRRALVGASIGMARELGLTSVAEGVETLADWDAVRAAGCDIAQGYFIAKPMPGEQLAAWAAALPGRFGAGTAAPALPAAAAAADATAALAQ